jgi:RND superfamily putative drug exporter
LQVVVPSAALDRAQATLRHTQGVAAVTAPERSGTRALVRVQPANDRTGGLIERLRAQLPAGSRVGGSAAEAHDLERALAGRMPFVYALVLTVGFILLLIVVRAPLAAGAAVLLNLVATAAAFGAAKLIFQDGVGEAVLGFKSQGFVDAWAPVFFFCLSFALAMDYTVFLLTSVRAEFERTGDAREALVEGLARSGRVINAAGAVMIVVFFTFGLSHPLPPKEMGVILGVAVLLDTMLVRLALLPAVLRLLGDRAWVGGKRIWAPGGSRVVRSAVPLGPRATRPAPPPT